MKELVKRLLVGKEKIEGISYEVGRGKGWMFEGKRVSIHQLEAYLVYLIWSKNS